jgi:hypothetical protein
LSQLWSLLRRLFRRRARVVIERLPPLDGRPYNRRPDEYEIAEDGGFEDSDHIYVWSVKTLPPAGSQELERRELVPALRSLIQAYLYEIRFHRYNDVLQEVFGPYSIGEFPDTREMWSYLAHPSAFSPMLVRRVQELLSNRFSLWRIVLAYEHCIMGVYPGGVWFGVQHDSVLRNDVLVSGPLDDDDPNFAAWSTGVRALAERLYGPLRRQLADLRPRVAPAIRSATERGIVALAAYDTNRLSLARGEQHPIVWCLEANGAIDWSIWTFWVNDEKPGKLPSYPVDSSGLIGPEYSDRQYPFEIVGYLIEETNKPFDVRLEAEGSQSLPLARIEIVISDQELIGRER